MRCWQKAKRVEAEEQKGAHVASSHAASDSARPLVVTRRPQEEGVGQTYATQDGILRQVYHKATDTNVSFSSPSAPRRCCLAMLVVVFGCVGCAKSVCKTEAGVQSQGLGVGVFISTCSCVYVYLLLWCLLLVAACVLSLVPATVLSLCQSMRASINSWWLPQ